MASTSTRTAEDDIHICGSSVLSHFVQVGKVMLVQVDIQPFLTQTQLEGFTSDWLTKDHLQEVLALLRPMLESCVVSKPGSDLKKSDKSKKFVLTGETVQVACSIRRHPEYNQYLITHFDSNKIKSKAISSKYQPSFEEKQLHREKIVAFVCPRGSSSILQLSQLVHMDVDSGKNVEDISRYFLPASDS